MEQLPTLEEVVSFIKEYAKIILITIIVGVVFYGIGIGYTIYSGAKATSNGASQSESSYSGDLFLSQIELDDLQKDSVSFSFYIENEDGTAFVNYNLLKKLLITQEVLKKIQDSSGITIEPTPKDAVNLTLDTESNLLELSVGTGDIKSNKAIANAYYNAMQNEDIEFLMNKAVYVASAPEKNKKEIMATEGTISLEGTGISSKKIVIYGVLILIFSSVLGLVIATVYSMTRKEIADTFAYTYKESDTIIDLSNSKEVSLEEKNEKIVHAVIHPKRKTKLLLSEKELDEGITKKIQKKLIDASQELGEEVSVVIVAKNTSQINPLVTIDEVIIFTKKKETTKEWYKNQRIQLENYDAPVKVIQI